MNDMTKNDPQPSRDASIQLTLVSRESDHGNESQILAHRGHTYLSPVDLALSEHRIYEAQRIGEFVNEYIGTEPVPEPLQDLLRYLEREAPNQPELADILQRMHSPEFNGTDTCYRTVDDVVHEALESGTLRTIAQGHFRTEEGKTEDAAGAQVVPMGHFVLLITSEGYINPNVPLTPEERYVVLPSSDVHIERYADETPEGDLEKALKTSIDSSPGPSGPA